MAAKETNLQRKKELGEISEIQGRDLHTHGENFPGALDASCIDGIGGFGTMIDSLDVLSRRRVERAQKYG